MIRTVPIGRVTLERARSIRAPALLFVMVTLTACCVPKPGMSTDPAATAARNDAPPAETADPVGPPVPTDSAQESNGELPTTAGAPATVAEPQSEAAVEGGAITLEVMRFDAARGEFSGNAALWSMLEELPGDPNSLLTARENGFRYAVAQRVVRPELQQFLERMTGVTMARDHGVPRTDGPIELDLSNSDQDLSVFLFDPSGGMSGRSFDRSRPILDVECLPEPGRPGVIRMAVTPEIRGEPGPPRYVREQEQFLLKPEYRGERFKELTVTLTLPIDGALIIGPTPRVHELPILGRPFLVRGEAEAAREGLYVLIPRIDGRTIPADEDQRP